MLPAFKELNLGGLGIEGYGCAGGSQLLVGLVGMEMARVDSSIATFFGVQNGLAMESIALGGSVTEISVVDGDTIDAHGQRYRMIGYDTPEVVTPRRKVGPDERAVATIAKERFTELLNSGPLDLTEVRCSCSAKRLRDGTCNHHRKCAILSLNGRNIGDTLIAEELAVQYVCSATRCPPMPDWPRILERQIK